MQKLTPMIQSLIRAISIAIFVFVSFNFHDVVGSYALGQNASAPHQWVRTSSNRSAQAGSPSALRRPTIHRAQNSTKIRSGSPVRTVQHEKLVAPGAIAHINESVPTSILVEDEVAYQGANDETIGVGDCCDYGCDSGPMVGRRCDPTSYLLDWSRADLWVGTASFSNSANFIGNANGRAGGAFGFQEGFNFGSRLPSLLGGQIGAQLGMRFIQSQLNGTIAGEDRRSQTFLTAGLFRRVDYGLQGGLVVDYLHDDWIYQADLLQLRGELGFLLSPCHEFGFRFTDNQQTDNTDATVAGVLNPVAVELETLNTYRFYYRVRFGEHGAGDAQVLAGFTDDSQGILGLKLSTPLQGQVGLVVDTTYLIPDSALANPYNREAWNLSAALVWTPGRLFGKGRDYYRPLLDVADNGSMIANRLP